MNAELKMLTGSKGRACRTITVEVLFVLAVSSLPHGQKQEVACGERALNA